MLYRSKNCDKARVFINLYMLSFVLSGWLENNFKILKDNHIISDIL